MQTSYSLNPESGQAGTLAYVGLPTSVLTCKSPNDEIVFGRMVQKVTGSDLSVERLSSPSKTKFGISILDQTIAIDEDTTLADAYPVNVPVGVMTKGIAWVEVDQTVTADDSVYARHCSTQQVQTIVFSADLITANSVACVVNGTALSATVYATNNAATLTALAAKIALETDILSAVSDGVHTITVTSKTAALAITGVVVTLGASQATAVVTTTTAGVEGEQGIFRKDSDSNKASAVSNARFLTSASSGGLAQVELY